MKESIVKDIEYIIQCFSNIYGLSVDEWFVDMLNNETVIQLISNKTDFCTPCVQNVLMRKLEQFNTKTEIKQIFLFNKRLIFDNYFIL